MDTVFQKIVIIGYGKIAGDILTYVYAKQKSYGYQLEFVEYEVRALNIAEQICRKNDISFFRITEKEELVQYLKNLVEKSLIISANNDFLFPPSVVRKSNIVIINFHNALLPNYPGRNAPSWVIYKGEKETGITWHFVSEDIDGGNIIIQKRLSIIEDVKAYELAESLMRLAFEGFKEIFQDILADIVVGEEQMLPKERKIYLSKEIPSGGKFELTESSEKIYRLLRSVDYGKNNIFPNLYTYYQGKKIEILRYRKIDKNEVERVNSFLYLPLEGDNILKMKYREIV